mmetsp:Transcript_57211/g.134143  ORF Transcript_57211/g.134143 Transcript_57211/m.134143 type:complete len:575 (+) Transcript_57211:268-1992(+)
MLERQRGEAIHGRVALRRSIQVGRPGRVRRSIGVGHAVRIGHAGDVGSSVRVGRPVHVGRAIVVGSQVYGKVGDVGVRLRTQTVIGAGCLGGRMQPPRAGLLACAAGRRARAVFRPAVPNAVRLVRTGPRAFCYFHGVAVMARLPTTGRMLGDMPDSLALAATLIASPPLAPVSPKAVRRNAVVVAGLVGALPCDGQRCRATKSALRRWLNDRPLLHLLTGATRSVALAPLAPVREDAIYRGLVVEVARIHLAAAACTKAALHGEEEAPASLSSRLFDLESNFHRGCLDKEKRHRPAVIVVVGGGRRFRQLHGIGSRIAGREGSATLAGGYRDRGMLAQEVVLVAGGEDRHACFASGTHSKAIELQHELGGMHQLMRHRIHQRELEDHCRASGDVDFAEAAALIAFVVGNAGLVRRAGRHFQIDPLPGAAVGRERAACRRQLCHTAETHRLRHAWVRKTPKMGHVEVAGRIRCVEEAAPVVARRRLLHWSGAIKASSLARNRNRPLALTDAFTLAATITPGSPRRKHAVDAGDAVHMLIAELSFRAIAGSWKATVVRLHSDVSMPPCLPALAGR